MNKIDIKKLEGLAKKVRINTLDIIYRTASPHIGSSFSCVDILVSLYFGVLNISSSDALSDKRDIFLISKGHACPALYAVLFEKKLLNQSDIDSFAKNGGVLQQHPDRNPAKGIEFSSGSLGHGLSVACGMAYAFKKDGRKNRIFVLLSDGELNEGSVWEAVMFAAHHKLDNISVIIDYNKMQALGFTKEIINLDPLSSKWKAFDWQVKEVDGHNPKDLVKILSVIPFKKNKPSVVIARTLKGKGVSFMENDILWHYRAPNQEEYKNALEQLSR